ncbi:Skm1p [Rhizophagus irregularis DAOM 197198w]|nr:Skm1p [Rhizophagus irregularis DAOM 197198w]
MGRLRYSYTCGVCNFKTKTIPCTKCTKYERHNNFDSGYKNVDDMIIASQSHAKDDRDFLEWIEFSQLRILETLDEGGFGTVYKAKWLDGLPMDASDVGRAWNRSHFNYVVAVKFFHNNKDFLKEFTNIYKMVRKFSEENEFPSNIVHYYGATYDYDNEHYGIVMEYYSHTSLINHLTYNWQEIYWMEKLYILRDISYGLHTLHSQNLIHGDLHSGNVMIDYTDESDIAFLGDLGFCRFEETVITNNCFNGVIPFIAPEIFEGFPYSKKADIYSFGMIMYHISTNKAPFYYRAHDTKLAKQISNGLRPKVYQEDGIPRCFVNLMRNCWNSDVRSRPNAYTLYEKFNSWIEYSEAFEDMEWNITEPSIYHRKAVYTSRSW